MGKLKDELNRMKKLSIIEKVSHPTDWVNNIVIVEKSNGSIRVCLDPKQMNKAIKRHYYQMPTPEEIFSQMAGSKYFTKLDASSGYWQMKIDKESSDLLVFNTPFGRYKFLRFPFGIHSASEIFQSELSQLIEGIDGTANVQDDIIIHAPTRELHDEQVRLVLTCIRESGLKLNKQKCKFGASQLSYLGHVISSEGLKPDSKKVQAILDMPPPQNKSDMQCFLGAINYFGKFIPNLSTLTEPLRKQRCCLGIFF